MKKLNASILTTFKINKYKTCCFTGHRPQKLPWGFDESDDRFLNMSRQAYSIIKNLINNGIDTFISGMAIGFDMMSAEMVLSLKTKFPYIKLYCALPCVGQSELWNKEYRDRYYSILKKADFIRFINNNYTNTCMQERNKFMIDNSSIVVALFNKNILGGTKNTIEYAKEKAIEIIIIDI